MRGEHAGFGKGSDRKMDCNSSRRVLSLGDRIACLGSELFALIPSLQNFPSQLTMPISCSSSHMCLFCRSGVLEQLLPAQAFAAAVFLQQLSSSMVINQDLSDFSLRHIYFQGCRTLTFCFCLYKYYFFQEGPTQVLSVKVLH